MDSQAFYLDYLRPIAVIAVFIALLTFNRLVFQKLFRHHDNKFILQRSVSLFLAFAALIAFILFLPIKESIQGQILSVIAIIVSAGIALSSTTVLGNIIAGIMNNSMNRFNHGDLIRIGDVQGRLVRKSPFHIEVQTEDSNFVTIPNLHVATHPVKLTRKTNTVISATVSLGYDLPRLKVEEALKAAALSAELKDPYVYIMELGDFSITYKVHGFLEDSSVYFSACSKLNEKILDELHRADIEIVSPTFMNQRQVGDRVFIPGTEPKPKESTPEPFPEELVFDAAMKSEALEERKKAVGKLQENLKTLQKSDRDIPAERVDQIKKRIKLLRERIEEEERKSENER
jgi:small-conductance mechanosensitive channel